MPLPGPERGLIQPPPDAAVGQLPVDDEGRHRPDAQALGPARHLRVVRVQHAARRQVRHAFLRQFPHRRFPFPSCAAWGMPVTSPPGP
jgi:hypothetical protein